MLEDSQEGGIPPGGQSTLSQLMSSLRNMAGGTASYSQYLTQLWESAYESIAQFYPTPGIQTLDMASSDIGDFFGVTKSTKFLDKYKVRDIMRMIRKSPLDAQLKRLGFDDYFIKFDLRDSFCHYLYLRSRHLPEDDKYLGFLIVRNDKFQFKVANHKPEMMEFLQTNFPDLSSVNIVDVPWLSLQNPDKQFTKQKLPGQRYTGSGFGRIVFGMIIDAARQARRDAISNTPEHFHNAYLYEGFFFVDPLHEAHFRQMKTDLEADIEERGLGAVSFAIDLGGLRLGEEKFSWTAGEQMKPLSLRVKLYFSSFVYTDFIAEEMCEMEHFWIDWESVQELVDAAVSVSE